MKNIQLINPKQASDLLSQWEDSFIQVLTKDKPVVLANSNCQKSEQVQGLQIEIKMGSAYKIDLASYPANVNKVHQIYFVTSKTRFILNLFTHITSYDFNKC